MSIEGTTPKSVPVKPAANPAQSKGILKPFARVIVKMSTATMVIAGPRVVKSPTVMMVTGCAVTIPASRKPVEKRRRPVAATKPGNNDSGTDLNNALPAPVIPKRNTIKPVKKNTDKTCVYGSPPPRYIVNTIRETRLKFGEKINGDRINQEATTVDTPPMKNMAVKNEI